MSEINKLPHEVRGGINVAAHRLSIQAEAGIREEMHEAVAAAIAAGADWKEVLLIAAARTPGNTSAPPFSRVLKQETAPLLRHAHQQFEKFLVV